MSHEFDDWRQADDGDAVVTYTRVSGRRRPKRAARPRPERAPDAVLDAAELHRAEPGERVGFDSAPHQVGAADIEDFVADRRPPKRRSFGMVGGALALVAGAAILATTLAHIRKENSEHDFS